MSYDLTAYIETRLRDPRVFSYRNAKERTEAVERLRNSDAGVLLAPSLERGVDLPYDACRVVIVAKIPFPYLGDKQVSARLYSHGGQEWYAVQTVRALVQMTGRGMRSADDSCTSYILDKQFVENVWKKSKRLLPAWWTEALDWSGKP